MDLERLSNRIESVENKLTEVANVLLSIGGDTSDLHSIGKGTSSKPTTPEGKGKVLIDQIRLFQHRNRYIFTSQY